MPKYTLLSLEKKKISSPPPPQIINKNREKKKNNTSLYSYPSIQFLLIDMQKQNDSTTFIRYLILIRCRPHLNCSCCSIRLRPF